MGSEFEELVTESSVMCLPVDWCCYDSVDPLSIECHFYRWLFNANTNRGYHVLAT